MLHPDSEDALEAATLKLLSSLGWQTVNAFDEVFGSVPFAPGKPNLGREDTGEVVLLSRLRPALQKLNPLLPPEALQSAIKELTLDRHLMSPAAANREVYRLLKEGVKVTVCESGGNGRGERDAERVETVRVIDWDIPENNDFLLVSQLWITGEVYKRRTDLVGFVNGLPLLFVELKAAHRQIKNAYTDNLTDYKDTIRQLFWYNAFILLSNGRQSVVGSLTAEWEHFSEWKKISSEGEQGVISLETTLRGTCAPARLLDLVENFILYADAQGGLRKLVAKYHQYFGVNNALEAARRHALTPALSPSGERGQARSGRLGVFWHTQGSGKSYSMVFFAQKVLRKLPGNWTFLIVTDREELDDQIYGNFAQAGVVTEDEAAVRAGSGEHLKQLLREDHRYLFTLIQKFHSPQGQPYPKLSDRSDIIVMTDEAHRSQYDLLALNMRTALPNAAFLAYTGTPLMMGEERTRQVFGEYVSIYNFAQSVADRATVPLYYENRIPEVQLTNANLNADMERLLEDAELDDAQEARLEREFSRDYHLITRNDRLEKIAEDIVLHFVGRGQRGKAMVVSIDKATAVRMYDKVQAYWQTHLAALRAERETYTGEEREALEETIRFMEETDMAVVVSQGQNEVAEFRKKGLDIAPHRRRMVKEDLAKKFKDGEDHFRLVFVCAMWMTGFDAPACSTIYMDRPMRNHTLMQTIARANRVFGDKVNGLIVDYVGIFRNLQKALAIYGSATDGIVVGGDWPVQSKQALIELLRKALAETTAFCAQRGVDLGRIQAAEDTYERVALRDDAVNALLANDETKLKYLSLADIVDRLFKAILPDLTANEFGPARKLAVVLAEQIRSEAEPPDISGVMEKVDVVLDRSVAAEAYVIKHTAGSHLVDLAQIDFEALKRQFATSRKNIEIARLRGSIALKLGQLVPLNKSRLDFYGRFQKLIEDYNAGALNDDAFFAQLLSLAQGLTSEEKRHIAEQLSEEELAVFDLLTRPAVKLTRKERKTVKKVAQELLHTLKAEKLVLDWRKKQPAKAVVRQCIEIMLDQLPDAYGKDIYQQKCEVVYQHVYESYQGAGRSIYG